MTTNKAQTTEATHLSALAGLLHDIGKLSLRAAEKGLRTWDEEARGDFKYKHAMLTATFVQRYVPAQWRQEVMLAAGNHHNPQRRADRVVQLADILSAAERDDGTTADAQVQTQHPKQLLSIFALLEADGQRLTNAERQNAYLPLAPLRMARDVLFPSAALPTNQVWSRYFDLWQEFAAAADKLKAAHEPDGDLPTYLESMVLLLQRVAWCVPSAYYRNVPDISLYDHSRMTAALAAVIGDSPLSDNELMALVREPEVDWPLALLVGGDLSGIQEFLYTITSRGATSALRGRSFYLQLLTEAIYRFVLSELGLPITNLIYGSGGHFFLIARPTDADRLPDIQRRVSRALLQHHRGSLYVALAGQPLTGADFFDGRFSYAWRKVKEDLQAAKLRRFSELDSADLEWLFRPQGDGGNEDQQCQVCGLEHPNTKTRVDDEGNQVRKCPACLSYEDLGDDLRLARFLALEEVYPPASVNLEQPPGRWADALATFGLSARVKDKVPTPNEATRRRVVLALKDEALTDLTPGKLQAVGRRFLVNVTPLLADEDITALRQGGFREWLPNAGRIKPFAALEWQSTGIKRLGVLRMDVDGLGRLFDEGLGQQATLSRVAALSFAVSLYFEGWVEALAEVMPGQRLYSIYSGGDDLFFVGAWDTVVEFARAVRRDLTPFAAGHPGVHASAGIVLVGGKYPLAQAAQDAGAAEEKAKKYLRRSNGRVVARKDAICFLGDVQPWQRFGLDTNQPYTVSSLAQKLQSLVGSGGNGRSAPTALIQTLARLYDQYAEARRRRQEAGLDRNQLGEAQPLWGPWMWRGVWLLTRMAERAGKGSSLQGEITGLRNTLQSREFRDMDWIGLAARWAELLTRSR